jgi:hypothetical protein
MGRGALHDGEGIKHTKAEDSVPPDKEGLVELGMDDH